VFPDVLKGIFSSIFKTNDSVGYVEFRNPGSVSEAISMTGQRLLGLPVIVQITEAEKNRQARLDAAAAYVSPYHTLLTISGAGPTKEAPIHRLYIGNIHFNLTEDDIKAVFAPFGEIEQVQLQKEHDTGRSRGYGFVQYTHLIV
jgi:RNA-binding protein 23/39